MTKEKIARINELAHKSKTTGQVAIPTTIISSTLPRI